MGEGRFQAEQVAVLCFGLGLAAMYIFLRRKTLESIKDLFMGQGRYLLSFWAVIYFGFIVFQRSTQHFDSIGTRLMMPVIVMGIILLTCLVVELGRTAGGKTYGRPFLLAMTLVACSLEVFIFITRHPYDRGAQGFSSERLNWIANQTTEKDLIIGDNAVDIPFYLKRPEVVSFSPFPYSAHFSRETLQNIVRRYRNSYSRIMIVVRKNNLSDDRGKYFYGDFVSNLRNGKTTEYREVVLIQELRDCLVYQATFL
jgi:hypothetical protein